MDIAKLARTILNGRKAMIESRRSGATEEERGYDFEKRGWVRKGCIPGTEMFTTENEGYVFEAHCAAAGNTTERGWIFVRHEDRICFDAMYHSETMRDRALVDKVLHLALERSLQGRMPEKPFPGSIVFYGTLEQHDYVYDCEIGVMNDTFNALEAIKIDGTYIYRLRSWGGTHSSP